MLFLNGRSFKIAGLTGLALSAGVAAQSRELHDAVKPPSPPGPTPPVDISIGFCSVRSLSETAKVEQDAYVQLWVDVGTYVCGGNDPDVVTIDEQVSGIAIAIAEAFAEISVNCFAQGNAQIRASAYAQAEERAEALGEAISEIFATTEVCGECQAAISALSQVSEVLIVEAVAEAWYELYLTSDAGNTASDLTTVTSSVINSTIYEVLSNVTGILRAGVDGDCSIDVINTAQVGPFLARCELVAAGVSTIVEVDAIAQAGAEAAAYACNGDIAESEVDVIAKATATAIAQALADAYVYCETQGGDNTFACGLTQTEVRAVAEAQAEAFAFAFAEAETCGCKVNVSADVAVWDAIWVEAAVNAYAETCSVGTGDAFDADFQFAFEERTLTATARAIAFAVAEADEIEGNECRVGTDVCASTSSLCVGTNSQCGGGVDFPFVLPCCNPDDICVVQNQSRFLCRNRNFPTPSFWIGTIAECTLPPPQ